MALPLFDLIFLIITLIIIAIDIILGISVRAIMPKHITYKGWYATDGSNLTLSKASEICPCLHRVFPEGTRKRFVMEHIYFKAFDKRSVADGMPNLEKYPYLVSLSIPAYSDDTQEKLFACNGLVHSKEWLLTTKRCVKDESEWYNLTVRSESPFWSKLGKQHLIVDVVADKYDGLVLLKVSPQFSDKLIPIPHIKYPFDGNWTYAASIGWNDQMYEKNVNFRYKYKTFDIEEWTSEEANSRSKLVCDKSLNCEMSSKPLLTSCRQLLGIKSTSKYTCDEFSSLTSKSDENTKSYKKNCYSVYEDMHASNEIEVCQI